MPIIEGVLQEELERLERMEKVYQEKLSTLPKGVIQCRKIKGREYVYLKFRDDLGKVRQKYIGPYNENLVDEYRKKIDQRNKHAHALKSIKHDKKIINKVIK